MSIDIREWRAAVDLAVEMLEQEDRSQPNPLSLGWLEESFIKLVKDNLNLTLLDARDVARAALKKYYKKDED